MNLAFMAGLIFAVFGIYMSRHALANYRRALASRHWPRVSGRITEIFLWGKRRVDGELIDAEKLNVKYEFELKGRQYTGTVPSFFTMVYPETLAFAQKHPCGSPVHVYYNPENPGESVLIPGPKSDKPYSELILGFFCILVGVVLAALGLMGVVG